MKFTLFAALFAVANGEAVSLTKANFDTEVFDSGKNAFIKFQAPWCLPALAIASPPSNCRPPQTPLSS